MGRSFWIVDDLSSVDDIIKPWTKKQFQLFKPRTTIRYRYRSTSRNSVPYYPAHGVILDYYLPSEPASDITITIKDQAVLILGRLNLTPLAFLILFVTVIVYYGEIDLFAISGIILVIFYFLITFLISKRRFNEIIQLIMGE
jgi:hypothetical protein